MLGLFKIKIHELQIQMGLTFNSFSPNSQRCKNAISNGNFHSIRICPFSLTMIQKGIIGQLKA
jgi:hypothetical protein